MREILFRGKRLDNGKWEYGDLMRDNVGGSYVFPNEAENLYLEYEVDPASVGQYSGLTDKNGNKIFEGDILRYSSAVGLYDCGVVYFSDSGCFSVEYRKNHRAPNILSVFLKHPNVEKVGNIHDTPELVKCGIYNE